MIYMLIFQWIYHGFTREAWFLTSQRYIFPSRRIDIPSLAEGKAGWNIGVEPMGYRIMGNMYIYICEKYI